MVPLGHRLLFRTVAMVWAMAYSASLGQGISSLVTVSGSMIFDLGLCPWPTTRCRRSIKRTEPCMAYNLADAPPRTNAASDHGLN